MINGNGLGVCPVFFDGRSEQPDSAAAVILVRSWHCMRTQQSLPNYVV